MTSTSAHSFLTTAALVVVAAALLHVTPSDASNGFLQLRGGLRILGLQQHVKTLKTSSLSKPVANSSHELFPQGWICERSSNSSPFRLTLASPAPAEEPGLQRYCFRVDDVGGCDPSQHCCDGQQGLQKVEFDVVSECKDSLRKVTVDGVTTSYEFSSALSVLRVTGLSKTATAAAGTEICLYLAAPSLCPGLAQLCSAGAGLCKYALFNAKRDCCPVGIAGRMTQLSALSLSSAASSSSNAVSESSQPLPQFLKQLPNLPAAPVPATSPPPASSFPSYQCQRDASDSRLFTTASNNVTVVNGLTRVCFDVSVKAVCDNPASKCCEFGLYKMEIDADPTCADALAYITVDGAKRARFFQTSPYPVIKITNINKDMNAVAGTEVCLFLRPQCNSLAKLCTRHDGSCTIGLFNKPASRSTPTCCPLSTV
ncbi:hypothetical protein Agub_g7275 [Astrephomene gubernaculifera]|uniref:Pherophorin domain-containing protein n=1 Tax=Astrephomene gubernaculifera TaxID=47775 RepID=A0AAD3DRF6_9CHLO|nr:hypothetical protein Agub_g7275 [Astrephomene gubernaculifera]